MKDTKNQRQVDYCRRDSLEWMLAETRVHIGTGTDNMFQAWEYTGLSEFDSDERAEIDILVSFLN